MKRIDKEFPEWVQWSYHTKGDLRFGNHRIVASAGVQQGDPLDSFLFSLVIMELVDGVGSIPLSLWYLDDGTFVGTRQAVKVLLDALLRQCPSYGLLVNVDNCEVFWSSCDQIFPEFPSEIKRVYRSVGGAPLLGSPVYGTDDFISSTLAKVVDKVLNSQSHLQDLGNPQVELHLLSCLVFLN